MIQAMIVDIIRRAGLPASYFDAAQAYVGERSAALDRRYGCRGMHTEQLCDELSTWAMEQKKLLDAQPT